MLLACATLFVPRATLANMANPVREGSAVGEPSGDLKAISIEREELTIDLRPLAEGSPVAVEAVYRINNEGGARTLNLLFVANALAEGASVWLDEKLVPYADTDAGDLPASWRPPQTTPSVDGGVPLPYEAKRGGALNFRLTVAPGAHVIRVRYEARATAHATGNSPNVYWQLGYVLSPARQWARFGGLDVRVLLPAGWKAASEPSMKRVGDALEGSWDGLPADALALTVQSPPKSQALHTAVRALTLVVGLVVCLAFGWVVGRWLGRRRRTSAWALPFSLAAALVWGVAFFASFVVSMNAAKGGAGGQASWVYGYGDMFLNMFYLILLVPTGLILTQASAFLAARLAAKRAAPNA
jgi:hypothetical protein